MATRKSWNDTLMFCFALTPPVALRELGACRGKRWRRYYAQLYLDNHAQPVPSNGVGKARNARWSALVASYNTEVS